MAEQDKTSRHRTWRIAISVFLVSLFIHLIGMGRIGRTWDEQFKVDLGYLGWSNLLHGRFGEEYWNSGTEHPMIAKYVYGTVSSLGLIDVTPPFIPSASTNYEVGSHLWSLTRYFDHLYLVPYDFSWPRFLSAVFNSATAALVYILAAEYLSPLVALVAPVSLLLMPRFIVMGQLVTFESWSAMLFTAMVYFLKHRRIRLAALCAALAFWSRYNNIYFLIFIFGYLYLHRPAKSEWKEWVWLPGLLVGIGLLSWPYIWHHFPTNLIASFTSHESRGIGPSLYFFWYLLVTTPIPLLLAAGLGLLKSRKDTLWWFLSALVFFTLLSVPGGGTRYMFVIYPALALLISEALSAISQTRSVIPIVIAGALWSSLALWQSFPYYLDYYNELVGGIPGAAARGYDISWWGEGQREAALWLKNNAKTGESVALYVTPKYVFPSMYSPKLKYFKYGEGIADADYVVASRADILKLDLSNFRPVYDVKVAGVSLVTVFKIVSRE